MPNPIDAIRTLYFNTTKGTVQKDLERAIDLFKTLKSEDDREKAAVFMDGLSQMRSEWGVRPGPAAGKTPKGSPGKSSRS
jgi:hypothetical protein